MRYTPPKMRVLRWLTGSPGADDLKKQAWLAERMFARSASLVAAAICELIIAFTAVHLHTDLSLKIWAGVCVSLFLCRISIIFVAKRSIKQERAVSVGLFAVSSLAWAANLGFGALICNLGGDTVLQVLCDLTAVSIVAGLSARNASTPRLAVAQIIIVLSLLCVGVFFAPQAWLKVILLQAPIYAGGLASVCLRSNRDLVSMLDAQQKNASLARRDVLTGLPNRVRATEELQNLLGCNSPAARFALIWIDLDRFKAVNDTLGHAAGDEVLVETGRRLQKACNLATASVARLGGDEFLVIAATSDQAYAENLAQAIALEIKKPYSLEAASDVSLDASIGIALYPDHGGRADALLVAADKALYSVKQSGRSRWQTYNPSLHAGETGVTLLRNELEQALNDTEKQFVLYYQPVVRLSDGAIAGREALIRWKHPVRGFISPNEFIPMAEASGFIIQLGEWAMQKACSDAAAWNAAIKVAVNVSPVQLRNGNFASTVIQAMQAAGLSPKRLEIEITETVLLSNDEHTIRNMQCLHEIGVEVVIDDFGTGFSSLSNLCRFVFDRIKIDGSFVREALNRRDCAAVIRATVGLARELGVPTTAECIETREQLDFVRACGCNDVQGNLFGVPQPLSNLLEAAEYVPAKALLSAA